MRLIDVDAAKAELLCIISITEDIHARSAFFNGIKVGYQSAADRLDTMPTVEERKHGHWVRHNNIIACSVGGRKYRIKLLPKLRGYYGR